MDHNCCGHCRRAEPVASRFVCTALLPEWVHWLLPETLTGAVLVDFNDGDDCNAFERKEPTDG